MSAPLATMPGLLHGWHGLLSAYAAVQLPLAAGLMRAGAPLGRWLCSPLYAVPLTVAAAAGIAAGAPLLSTLGVPAGGALELSLAVALCGTLGYRTGRSLALTGLTALPATLQRGALVTDASPPAAQLPRACSRGKGLPGVTLAGLPVTLEDEVRHFKLIGATGSGKSTAIRELLGAALSRGDRAVIADPDGGYLRHFYNPGRGDVILNPFEPQAARWDLFGEIDSDYDVEQLARSLVPDHEGADRSWRGYARTFFSAVTSQARAAGCRDMRELYRLLVMAGSAELKTLVAGTPAQPFLEEHNGRMFDSIRSVTSSSVAALDYVSRQRGAPLSVREWVRAAPEAPGGAPQGVLFMPYRATQIAALRSIISAWMRLAIFEVMNRPEEAGDQRLWLVVDELDALGQIDGLKDALARLRKFGGRCVLGFQSVAQVSGTYGSGEAQTLVENAGTTLILRCSGSEHGGTSRFASRLIGDREVMRISRSYSRRATELVPAVTRGEQLCIEPAVMSSEIEQLPDLTGYLKLASQPAWLRVRLARSAIRQPDAANGWAGPVVAPEPRRALERQAGLGRDGLELL
jgi:hypothetical protein